MITKLLRPEPDLGNDQADFFDRRRGWKTLGTRQLWMLKWNEDCGLGHRPTNGQSYADD